jgi:diguanylate cyclase
VLNMVSERVCDSLPTKALIARISGDEFSILLPNVKDILEVEDIAKNILEVFKHDYFIEGRRLKITVSIGISMYPVSGQDPEELIKNADLAMYIAKERGKNTYQVFTDEIKKKFVKRRKLDEDLKYAIKDNQFDIYYQPIINVEKNTVSSVEALLRWNHPEKGLITPGEFIPLVEENGLIIPIGEWIFRNACLQVKQWHREGLSGLALKVNLSVRQFEQENFVEMIASILHDTGINPELFELEITESMLMGNTDHTLKIFNKLKALNVKIALDDFGKGFSSLSYLTQFPFDVLKIDRSFIQKMLIDDKSAAIVKTVIHLGHQLNLKVVAEGVETEDQLKFLINNQCEEVQGFLFNKPLSVQEFEVEYLKGHFTRGLKMVPDPQCRMERLL